MPNIIKRLSNLIEELRWEDATSPSWWANFLRGQVRIYFYIAREMVRDNCLQRAAALTYTTLLSLIPLLVVAFSIFRAFESFNVLESRAESAIFAYMLAEPLRSPEAPDLQPAPSPEGQETQEQVPAEQVLKAADALPRRTGAKEALELYAEALDRGGDAAAGARLGLSTIHLRYAPGLSTLLADLSPAARAVYARAAGAPAPAPVQEQEEEEEEEDKRPSMREQDRFARERFPAPGQSYEEAIEELGQAEQAGYQPEEVRKKLSELQLAFAQSLSKDGESEQAADHYRQAALSATDALFLAENAFHRRHQSDLLSGQEAALEGLGMALRAVGEDKLKLYEALKDKVPEPAGEILQEAITALQEASEHLEASADARLELADALWMAGRQDEARRQYKSAAEMGSRERAAQGFSTAVVDEIRGFTRSAGARLGAVGIIFLVITATGLFNTMERTINRIWNVRQRRSLWIRFTSFCTVVWLGPALIGVSILIRERLARSMEATVGGVPVLGGLFQVLAGLGRFVLPFLILWLVLLAIYKFLPRTHVKFVAAAWGAFVATVLLQIARPGFSFYIRHLLMGENKYYKLYGSLGVVPIFMLWIWVLWVIVLFGVEVSFTVQSLGMLRFQDRLGRISDSFIDRRLAARIMMYVGRAFWGSGRPMGIDELAETLNMSREAAADATRRLVALELLTPVGEDLDEFHPAKDLSRLTLLEVLSVSDKAGTDSRSSAEENRPFEEALEEVFELETQSRRRALDERTFRDLLEECESRHGAAASVQESDADGSSDNGGA